MSYYYSISEGKINKIQGLVYRTQALKSYKAAIWVVVELGGTKMYTQWPLYSPKVAKIDVMKYGSNKNRRYLSDYFNSPDNYLKSKTLEPFIKGKGHKLRTELGVNKRKDENKSGSKQKTQKTKSIRLEKIDEELL